MQKKMLMTFSMTYIATEARSKENALAAGYC
jgi:hypothetical protein